MIDSFKQSIPLQSGGSIAIQKDSEGVLILNVSDGVSVKLDLKMTDLEGTKLGQDLNLILQIIRNDAK